MKEKRSDQQVLSYIDSVLNYADKMKAYNSLVRYCIRYDLTVSQCRMLDQAMKAVK